MTYARAHVIFYNNVWNYSTTTGLYFGTSAFLSRLRSNDYFSTTG